MDIRPPRPQDDLEAELDLARRAFGPFDEAGRARFREFVVTPAFGQS